MHKKRHRNVPDERFTPVEKLLIFTITGIIATIVIPNLINAYQDTLLKEAWKKTFTTFNKAYLDYASTKGISMLTACNKNGNNCIRQAFGKYFMYSKTCEAGTGNNLTYGGCWHYLDSTSKCINGDPNPVNWWKGGIGSVLNDGTLVVFWKTYSNVGIIFVDVNGFNGPNVVGKDIFGIAYDDTQLYPTKDGVDVHNGGTACGWANGNTILSGN